MEEIGKEYTLSLYGTLIDLKNSPKSNVVLVQNQMDSKIYIKKELKKYNVDVYKAMLKINHKNTPKIYEVIELKNTLYIIEEFINGNTLEEILEKNGHLDEKIVIKYIMEICNILEILHNRTVPIIHRDIKPSNIIISNDNVLKLIDFDISRVHRDESCKDTYILGTQGYASPEQFGFDQTDCRSDIYSLGIMMNVLTTGEHPMSRKNKGILKDIIEKCTYIAAEKRYENVIELKLELAELIGEGYLNKEENLKVDYNEYKKTEIKENRIKIFIGNLPGYRSGEMDKKVIATLWYLFLIGGICISFENFTMEVLIENTTVVLMLLSYTLLFANYKNINNKLPLLRDKKIRKVGLLIYSLVIFFVGGVFFNFLR